MPTGKKKKAKAKKPVKKTKAAPKAKVKAKGKTKRKIVPKKNFAARAKMLGVLCIKPNGESALVKRFTKEVRDSADQGLITAILLKGPRIYSAGQFQSVKSIEASALFPFLGIEAKVTAPAPVPAATPIEAVVESPVSAPVDASPEAVAEADAETYANGHDPSPATQEQPSAQV